MEEDSDGDQDARFRALLPLAGRIARRWELRSGADFGECLTAAMMGAWDAACRFNPSEGIPLERYAWQRIEGSIIDEWRRDTAWSRAGRNLMVKATDMADPLFQAAFPEAVTDTTAGNGFEAVEIRELVASLLVRLNVDDADLLWRSCVLGETLKSIGESRGVTESRASQLRTRALDRARELLAAMDLAHEDRVPRFWFVPTR